MLTRMWIRLPGLMGLGIKNQVAGPWAEFEPRFIFSKENDDLR